MARIDFLHVNDQNLLFYDLDAAVGRGCPNLRDDVLLVQFFLKAIFRRVIGGGHAHDPDRRPRSADVENIRAYQTFQRNINARLSVVDGRVDPVPGKKGVSSITHTRSTILDLET